MKAAFVSAKALVGLSLFTVGIAATGCGGGGGGRGGSAPINSGVTPVTTVSATVALNHFAALREKSSVSDLQIRDSALLRTRAFVLEDRGFVRVLDLAASSSGTPVLNRAIQLDPAGALPVGAATGALALPEDRTALATTSGTGFEAVYAFDPVTAMTANDVTKINLNSTTVSFSTPQKNSKGVTVASPMSVTFTASATTSSGKLFIASSNLDASFDYNPGTVLAFDYNSTTRAISGGALIVTSDFNPTRLTVWRSPLGQEAVLCVNGGAFGQGKSSVDVIDPVRAMLVATIPITSASATGAVAITPDGKRGFVGSTSAAELYELDLSGLETVLSSNTVQSLPSRLKGRVALPGTGGLNFVSGVGIATSGKFLYATNFNSSVLSVVDIQGGRAVVCGQASGFARTGDPKAFTGNTGNLAVRPGIPGTDFVGPSVLVVTISLATADRTVSADVSCAVDGVTFDKN